MKNGKRPTRRQKQAIADFKLKPENWLVERDTPAEFVIVHRHTGTKKKLHAIE